jgi:histone deacetylase 1/2
MLHLSCPYTSQQNGKTERAIRTINDTMRTIMFHAHAPSQFWAEALATATYLLNRRPSTAIKSQIPYTLLHGRSPPYDRLRVFGCLCYPNVTSTTKHKLGPPSLPCVFLGYPSNHRGEPVLISRHIVFDETIFPFQIAAVALTVQQVPPRRLDFLFTDLDRPLPGLATAAARAPPVSSAAAPRQDATAAR